jgi:hypothetical protein
VVHRAAMRDKCHYPTYTTSAEMVQTPTASLLAITHPCYHEAERTTLPLLLRQSNTGHHQRSHDSHVLVTLHRSSGRSVVVVVVVVVPSFPLSPMHVDSVLSSFVSPWPKSSPHLFSYTHLFIPSLASHSFGSYRISYHFLATATT